MKKLNLFISAFFFCLQFSLAQDNLKTFFARTDSLTAILDKDGNKREIKVEGNSALGEFRGVVYKDSLMHIRKAILNFDTAGLKTLYYRNGAILKIETNKEEYYFLNKQFYSKGYNEIRTPGLVKEFLALEEILRNLSALDL